jgi:hypothetical protein
MFRALVGGQPALYAASGDGGENGTGILAEHGLIKRKDCLEAEPSCVRRTTRDATAERRRSCRNEACNEAKFQRAWPSARRALVPLVPIQHPLGLIKLIQTYPRKSLCVHHSGPFGTPSSHLTLPTPQP